MHNYFIVISILNPEKSSYEKKIIQYVDCHF
jgi:hypothetical protein